MKRVLFLSILWSVTFYLHVCGVDKLFVEPFDRALFNAVIGGNLQQCTEIGQKVQNKKVFSKFLPTAAAKGHIHICAYLLSVGANPDEYALNGYTALHYAAKNGDVALIELLCSKGADVNVKFTMDPFAGLTPLFFAIGSNSLDACKALVSHKASVNYCVGFNKKNGTPLEYAVKKNNFEIGKLLIFAGAETHGVDVSEVSDITKFITMINKLRRVQEKTLKICDFAYTYFNAACPMRKENAYNLFEFVAMRWGKESELFKQLWGCYDNQLRDYCALVVNMNRVKMKQLSLVSFCNQYVKNEANLHANYGAIVAFLKEENATNLLSLLL